MIDRPAGARGSRSASRSKNNPEIAKTMVFDRKMKTAQTFPRLFWATQGVPAIAGSETPPARPYGHLTDLRRPQGAVGHPEWTAK